MKKVIVCLLLSIVINTAYSQVDQVSFLLGLFDLNANPRTQLNSMSLKIFDEHKSFRVSPAIAPGNNSYGTILAINGRENHWEHNLYFGADKKIYYRMCGYVSWAAEDGTIGGYNHWRTILDSKSDIESEGLLKLSSEGNHYIAKGKLGIGTINPTEKLSLVGSGAMLGIYDTNPISEADNRIGRYSKSLVIQNNKAGGWQDNIVLHDSGNVGIGTVTPSYKLDVKGTIRAQELKVDMQGADFVFEDDYQLRSLEEVETFVNENKHLPDVAPAKEMQENGVNQSEMNQKLLQKIEELTLYTIQQQKQLDKQSKLIEQLLSKQK